MSTADHIRTDAADRGPHDPRGTVQDRLIAAYETNQRMHGVIDRHRRERHRLVATLTPHLPVTTDGTLSGVAEATVQRIEALETGYNQTRANYGEVLEHLRGLQEVAAELRQIAVEQTEHVNIGNCPDVDDPDARDPNCWVCRAITAYDEKVRSIQ